jgi:N-methylhydantoinase A
VNAIEEITVKQGIDPEDTLMIGGGGAAGLNGVAIARRLRCKTVIFPDVGAALTAAGAVMSELRAEVAHTEFMRASRFDCRRANAILADLNRRAQAASAASPIDGATTTIDCAIEARYPSQVWEIEVPLRAAGFAALRDVRQLVEDFHTRHRELFGFSDDGDEIEIVSWRAVARTAAAGDRRAYRVQSPARDVLERRMFSSANGAPNAGTRAGATRRRRMTFHETGRIEAPGYNLESLQPGEPVSGPAIIESSFTTVVVHPGARAERRPDGVLAVEPRV